jgi:hypothetical protein
MFNTKTNIIVSKKIQQHSKQWNATRLYFTFAFGIKFPDVVGAAVAVDVRPVKTFPAFGHPFVPESQIGKKKT